MYVFFNKSMSWEVNFTSKLNPEDWADEPEDWCLAAEITSKEQLISVLMNYFEDPEMVDNMLKLDVPTDWKRELGMKEYFV